MLFIKSKKGTIARALILKVPSLLEKGFRDEAFYLIKIIFFVSTKVLPLPTALIW
jgi:hypothetical protein